MVLGSSHWMDLQLFTGRSSFLTCFLASTSTLYLRFVCVCVCVNSIGSAGQISFEKAIFDRFNTVVDTFDPTLTSEKLQVLNSLPFMRFHEVGLTGSSNALQEMENMRAWFRNIKHRVLSPNAKLSRIDDIMKSLHHSFIHIFKIDCEGCEVSFFKDLKRVATRDKPIFGQILVEFHRWGKKSTFCSWVKPFQLQ